jgi:hypothetical protein
MGFVWIYSSWSGFGDELAWSAGWLYRATNDAKYLRDVEAHFAEFGLDARPEQFSWDDKTAGVQVGWISKLQRLILLLNSKTYLENLNCNLYTRRFYLRV